MGFTAAPGWFPGVPGLEKSQRRPRLTSAGGQGAAPLAIGQALGLGSSLQAEAGVALEFGHVVEVELGALGEAVGGVARVATGDGCKHKVEMSLTAGGKRGLFIGQSSGGRRV